MGSTFLNLTNSLLRMINETPLTAGTFADARSIHVTAKEAILKTVQRLNKNPFEWPFNSRLGTITTVPGQSEYLFPANYKIADWNSFYIEDDPSLNTRNLQIKKIDRDEYFSRFRTLDLDASPDGRQAPRMVFEGQLENTVGFTPLPNDVYTIHYRYFIHPVEMTTHSSECNIPSEWDYVILAGALYLMKIFKNDYENASLAKADFEDGKREMRTLLVNQHYEYMRDTRLPENRFKARFFGYGGL